MAWIKIPAENHPIFRGAVPRDPRVTMVKMFGALVALVNGNMFGGLFARSIFVKLGEADRQRALALDGTEPFDPMGTGRVMTNTLLLPESVMDEPAEMRAWLRRAFEHAATLPAKKKKAKAQAKAKVKATAKAKPTKRMRPKTKTKTKAKKR